MMRWFDMISRSALCYILLIWFSYDELLSNGDRSWHIFRDDHQLSNHPQYLYPYAQFIRDRWNSTYNSTYDANYAELEYDRAIEIIYQHQHPADCSKVNYLISGGTKASYASSIIHETNGLAIAMMMNRIYLPNRDTHSSQKWKLPPDYCSHTNSTVECYFEPWSHCTWDDVDAILTASAMSYDHIAVIGHDSPELMNDTIIDHADRVVEIRLHNDRSIHNLRVPNITAFQTLIDWHRITSRFHAYWWRAVASSYLSIPNMMSYNLMQQNALTKAHNVSGQCIAMYLPNGDQHANFTSFAMIAEQVYDMMVHERGRYRRMMVIASNNPALLNDAIGYSNDHGWSMSYNPLHHLIYKGSGLISSHLPHLRAHYHKYERNQNYQVEELASAYRDHLPLEYVSNMINMMDFMQCDAYVCSLASSFCQLLDAMRTMVGMKPGAIYADMSYETCYEPPCLTYNRDFKSLVW